MWRNLNLVIHRNRPQNAIEKLNIDGVTLTGSPLANAFSDFFLLTKAELLSGAIHVDILMRAT